MKRTLIIVTLAALATACIVKSTTHTLYLESDGSVTWCVLESDVHSDEDELATRVNEEQAFLDGPGRLLGCRPIESEVAHEMLAHLGLQKRCKLLHSWNLQVW